MAALAGVSREGTCLMAFMVSPQSPATRSTSFRNSDGFMFWHHEMLPCWSTWISEHTKMRVWSLGMRASLAYLCDAIPPNPSNTMVACTKGYTDDAEVWALSLVQGPFSTRVEGKPVSFDSRFVLQWHIKPNPCSTQEYYTDSGFEFNT
jgi:hypothetical protein